MGSTMGTHHFTLHECGDGVPSVQDTYTARLLRQMQRTHQECERQARALGSMRHLP